MCSFKAPWRSLPRPSKLLPLMPRNPAGIRGICDRDQTILRNRNNKRAPRRVLSHLTACLHVRRKPAMDSWQTGRQPSFLAGKSFVNLPVRMLSCCPNSFSTTADSERLSKIAGSAFVLVTELFLSAFARIFLVLDLQPGCVCLRYQASIRHPVGFCKAHTFLVRLSMLNPTRVALPLASTKSDSCSKVDWHRFGIRRLRLSGTDVCADCHVDTIYDCLIARVNRRMETRPCPCPCHSTMTCHLCEVLAAITAPPAQAR